MTLATFNMEEGVVRRMRSVFRKKMEETPEPEATEPEKKAESDWVNIRTMLMRVLGRFPEARAAVVEELLAMRRLDPNWAT